MLRYSYELGLELKKQTNINNKVKSFCGICVHNCSFRLKAFTDKILFVEWNKHGYTWIRDAYVCKIDSILNGDLMCLKAKLVLLPQIP